MNADVEIDEETTYDSIMSRYYSFVREDQYIVYCLAIVDWNQMECYFSNQYSIMKRCNKYFKIFCHITKLLDDIIHSGNDQDNIRSAIKNHNKDYIEFSDIIKEPFKLHVYTSLFAEWHGGDILQYKG